jgi:hypothetical protein
VVDGRPARRSPLTGDSVTAAVERIADVLGGLRLRWIRAYVLAQARSVLDAAGVAELRALLTAQ